MKKILEHCLKILIYLTFFVPLLFPLGSFIFPFIVPKVLLFRSLVEIMLGVYILLLIINWQEYRPRWNWLTGAVGIFIISFALSTFFGVDWYHSFWDNHERMLGLFTVVHYGLYFLILSSVLKTWAEWQKALKIFLLAGTVVMMIGIVQAGNPFFLLNNGSDRVASTLGNPIYVGGFGMFLIFIASLLFLKEKKAAFSWLDATLMQLPAFLTLLAAVGSQSDPNPDNRVKLIWIGYIILFMAVQGIVQLILFIRRSHYLWHWFIALNGFIAFLGLLFSGTRGTLLGLLIGGGLAVVIYAIVYRKTSEVRKIVLPIMGVIVVLGGLIVVFRNTAVVQRIPAVGRLASTSVASVVEGPRFIAWQIAWQGTKERPVFGWGPNNFFYTFNKYYNPRSLEFGFTETWFDNAHNVFMNTLAVQGIVGLVTYLAIFVVGIVALVRAYRLRKIDVHILVMGSAFLIAHLIHNTTVFENPTSYLYFMVWLAFIVWNRYDKREEASNKGTGEKKVGALGVVAVGLLVLILVGTFNLQPARANGQALAAIRSLSFVPRTTPPDKPLSAQDVELLRQVIAASPPELRKALDFRSPHIDDIRSDVSRTIVDVLSRYGSYLTPEHVSELLDLSQRDLPENLHLHPLDIRNQLILAESFQVQTNFTRNPLYLVEAEKYYEDALRYSPRRQQILYVLALIKSQLGKKEEAIALSRRAVEGDPRISQSHWRLAYIYRLSNQPEEAKKVIDEAIKNGVRFNEEEQNFITSQVLLAPEARITTSSASSQPKK